MLRMLVMSMKSSITASVKLPISVLFMIGSNRSFMAAALFILLSAALVFSSVSAFADFRSDSFFIDTPALREVYSYNDLASGAAIDGALGALGVKLALGTGALLTTKNLIESIIYGTPAGVVGYEYNGSFYDLVDQSTIRIRDDVVTIDGVDYKDIWLPHDAAAKFRVNAFDFITFYNIVSESSGSYASGAGLVGETPIYSYNGYLRTPSISISEGTYSNDIFTLVGAIYSGHYWLTCYSNGVTKIDSQVTPPSYVYGVITSNHTKCQMYRNGNSWGTAFDLPESFVSEPFDFDWTSSVIPADPLPAEQGLRFRVPSSYVSSFPSTISPDLADYATLVHDLSSALEQARLANVVESTAFEEFGAPIPSSGSIAEEPYSSLDSSLSGIQDSLDNIDTNIGTVDESLDDIQIYAQDASESLQSIDTNLSQSVADTAGIKGFIQTYLPGIHSFLNGISTSVSNIAGSVAAADQTFFGNVVDAILAPFTPVFNIFKSGVGIWRYVVAWVGNISAPFSWIWSTLSQANGILVSPILASAAAAVVLAVYKKFGR